MSEQNSLQVASGDAVEDVTNTPANNKKCSTKSMLLLGTGTVFVVIGIALGAYHAGTDAQKSAANSALESVKEKIEGIFGDDEEQQANTAISDTDIYTAPAPPAGGTVTFGTDVTVTVDLDTTTTSSKSGKSASSKSSKKSSLFTSSTKSKKKMGSSSKSSKSDGGTASPTTDMLSGKSGKVGNAKSSKSGVVTTSSPSTDGLTTSAPSTAKSSKSGVVATSSPSTDGLPAGGLGESSGEGSDTMFFIEKDEEVATAEIAFMSLSQAEYSMSMFGRRQYN